jgi:threonine/homoserine/homoserine lactone efflux protein
MATSGLVEKFDNGRKWTYYYLTRKGRNILHPHETAKILVLLGVSILALASGVTNVLSLLAPMGAAPMAAETLSEAAAPRAPADQEMAALSEAAKAVEPATCASDTSIIIGAILIASGIFLGYLAYRMWSRGRPKKFKQNAR